MRSKESNLNKMLVITGGLGFIGKNFLRKIINHYERIIIIDKFSAHSDISYYETIADSRCQLIKSDIGDVNSYSSYLLSDFDLINFAAESHVDRSFINSIDFSYNNYISTHKMLEHFRISELNPRIIHISTDEVYGTVLDKAADEDALIKPTNPYSVSKAAADLLCQTYIKCYGLNILIVRPNNIYGPFHHSEKLIPACVIAANGGRKLSIHGNGEQLRSFLHVDDFSDAILNLLELNWDKTNQNIFNISSANEFTVNDVIQKISKFSKKDVSDFASYSKDRPFNDLRYFTSCDRIKKLGWKEKMKFDDELVKIYSDQLVFN